MGKTLIEWTDRSANPIRARHKVTGKIGWSCVMFGPGCQHCYSQSLNGRFGTGLPFTASAVREVETFFDPRPLETLRRLREPQRIFVCDMTDLFMDSVPDEWIDTVFAYAALSPQHVFQILTKRSARMLNYMSDVNRPQQVIAAMYRERNANGVPVTFGWPPENCWLGVSCEDQDRAESRLIHLIETPAAVRFVSYEPLLGSIDPTHVYLPDRSGWWNVLDGRLTVNVIGENGHPDFWVETVEPIRPPIDWAIIGGESGGLARPCELNWVRSLVDACRRAGVATFVKQLGSAPLVDGVFGRPKTRLMMRNKKGGDPLEWPADLRVREFPLPKEAKT